MVSDSLRDEIFAVAAVAEACPERYRDKCFELLLSDLLYRRQSRPADRKQFEVEPGEAAQTIEETTSDQEDLTAADLHAKARKFLQRHTLSLDHVNQLFYKEDGEILPLYEDIQSNVMSECQIRIALLQALRRGILNGEFDFSGEEVRTECQERKCYDGKNFTANFRNNAQLFDGFSKYQREKPVVKLSEAGRRELAQLIEELQ